MINLLIFYYFNLINLYKSYISIDQWEAAYKNVVYHKAELYVVA